MAKEDFFRCEYCITCECLLAPWVPQGKLEECISIWQREARRLPILKGEEPSSSQKVMYLQEIAPEEMVNFFRQNCQG